MIQYEATPHEPGETWLSLNECPDRKAPVCEVRAGSPDTVHVAIQDNTTASLRYKHEIDRQEQLREGIRDLRMSVDRFMESVRGLIDR